MALFSLCVFVICVFPPLVGDVLYGSYLSSTIHFLSYQITLLPFSSYPLYY